MQDLMGFIWFVSLIAFIVYWRKKANARAKYGVDSEEYRSVSTTKRIIGIVCLVAFFGIAFFAPKNAEKSGDNNQTKTEQASSTSSSKDKAAQEAKSKAEKKAASDEIRQILGQVPQQVDEVEHLTNYKTWGENEYPAQTAIWWYMQVKDGKTTDVHINLVHFTTGMEWVFWDKMIFANGNSKWTKTLNTFAGQSGDGKNTQIVMGGKYETWRGSIKEVREGMKILAQDGKPILRLQGKYKDDIYLTADDVQRVRTALRLQDLIDKIDHQLVD